MSSQSLARWNADRRAALQRLEKVHTTVTGGLVGRPRDVTELNHALFLRLAGEVQGYCRDLHDEAIDVMCTSEQIPIPWMRGTCRVALGRGRRLDSGNAGPGNIGNDWAQLGIPIWGALSSAHPGPMGAADWNARLEWLNSARNGIAHSDPKKIRDAHLRHPLTLKTFRVMRLRLGRFATALDHATRAYLENETGVSPW